MCFIYQIQYKLLTISHMISIHTTLQVKQMNCVLFSTLIHIMNYVCIHMRHIYYQVSHRNTIVHLHSFHTNVDSCDMLKSVSSKFENVTSIGLQFLDEIYHSNFMTGRKCILVTNLPMFC